MALRLRSFFLSLAVACLCVLSLGSRTAYADLDEYDFVDEEVQTCSEVYSVLPDGSYRFIDSTDWLSGNTTSYHKRAPISYAVTGSTKFAHAICFQNTEEQLMSKDNYGVFTYHNLYNYLEVSDGNYAFHKEGVSDVKVYLFDVGGTPHLDTGAEWSISGSNPERYNLTIETSIAPFPVYKINVFIEYELDDAYHVSNWNYETGAYSGYAIWHGYDDHHMSWTLYGSTVATQKENLEVNKGILESVKAIASSITELPNNIWGVFEDGLTNLFVPDDESIANMQQQWNDLLADRFGALYQVGDLVTDFADAFKESEQKTVTLPSITVPVGADGWTFGGWEIQVVPDGMEVLFTTLKTLVSIVATFLFVNGLKRRFEGLIGGAPTA